jgi:hypothetical protein
MTVYQRMLALLRRGPMTAEAIAEEIDKNVDTVTRTARRYKNVFNILAGGRLSLLERRAG